MHRVARADLRLVHTGPFCILFGQSGAEASVVFDLLLRIRRIPQNYVRAPISITDTTCQFVSQSGKDGVATQIGR